MKTKKIWVLTLLLLLSMVLMTACGGKDEIKYAEEMSELGTRLTDELVPLDGFDREDPASVSAALTAIDKVIPICNEIAALEAPSKLEHIQDMFTKGAECYSQAFQLYKQMLQLPEGDEYEEQRVELSMSGSELLTEGGQHFQDAFERLKSELE